MNKILKFLNSHKFLLAFIILIIIALPIIVIQVLYNVGNDFPFF